MPVILATTPDELEACYTIRKTVFVEEQNVPIDLEMDDYDAVATHFLLTDDQGQPLGTARLLDKHGLAKIGRVAILKEVRGQGLGLVLMQAILDESRRRGFLEAILDSQTYAIPFYVQLGFVAEGDEFDDAGIPHYTMRRPLV